MFKLILFILLIILALLLVLPMVLYPFANHLEFLQKYYCKIGWHCHIRDYQYDYNDGTSNHCTCKWCGYKGMVDSQGNLF